MTETFYVIQFADGKFWGGSFSVQKLRDAWFTYDKSWAEDLKKDLKDATVRTVTLTLT